MTTGMEDDHLSVVLREQSVDEGEDRIDNRGIVGSEDSQGHTRIPPGPLIIE